MFQSLLFLYNRLKIYKLTVVSLREYDLLVDVVVGITSDFGAELVKRSRNSLPLTR